MTHPYTDLPADAFWRTAVAEPLSGEVSGLWSPKWPVTRADKIATAGSCFAQHIGRALSARDYAWTDFEPAPPFLRGSQAAKFNYGVFSFRTGNIYTPRMLNQWLDLALDGHVGPEPFLTSDGRFVDPMRPMIEPDGFATELEFYTARQATAAAIAQAVKEADIFVFTLGLTECWRDAQTQVEYAACPGTLGGRFEAGRHVFHNMRFAEVLEETTRAISRMRTINWKLRVLLTVSPVPLTATATGQHVLTATTQSKSILRAVASELTMTLPEVDYFPSYELVTSPAFEGRAFADNKRSVRPEAVDEIMARFFADQMSGFPEVFAEEMQAAEREKLFKIRTERRAARALREQGESADTLPVVVKVGKTTTKQTAQPKKKNRTKPSGKSHQDVVCEEAMLDAFSR
ncbi:MAG: GSCFA domain-containing protein [Sulfitobacter sp.]